MERALIAGRGSADDAAGCGCCDDTARSGEHLPGCLSTASDCLTKDTLIIWRHHADIRNRRSLDRLAASGAVRKALFPGHFPGPADDGQIRVSAEGDAAVSGGKADDAAQ